MQVRTLSIAVAALTLGLSALGLSGCGEARKSLGWDKNAPDEFKVVSRAPLALPPDFALRPPEPGAAPTNEVSMQGQAQTALFGKPMTKPAPGDGGRSPGEAALLKAAGTDKTVPGIRGIVDNETSALALADKPFTDKLVFWKVPEHPAGPVVDAPKEAKRLRENQALGQPVTEGETPVIIKKKRALLEGLF
ncbi:MAG: DUF3035 domain-containing protein [Alphaproteobacteria bacterium]|nr:DUF3035 domain-containing protein [Alphaproteobacteria bacterium]MBF0130663.1 DUF3035 domain-containing protein [Alphaproteobacteria bacterium]